MKLFFFDIIKGAHKNYDLVGQRFRDADHARSHSELVALDISCEELDQEKVDWFVEVRTPEGDKTHETGVPQLSGYEKIDDGL